MQSQTVLPRPPWYARLSLGLAIGLVVIGALTLAGWWLRIGLLVQPFPNQPALPANAAVGFLALGLACLALGKWIRCLGATVATVVGLLSLFQEVTHADFRIDQLLVRDQGLVGTESPGRIPALVAGCLLLGGLVSGWRALGRGGQARRFAEGMAGSVIGSAGLSTLLGYGSGLPLVYTWGTATATAPVAAMALCFLGAALVFDAWRECAQAGEGPPRWAPLLAVISVLSITVVLWIGLRARDEEYTRTATMPQLDQFAAQIKDAFDQQSVQIERIARAWGDGPETAYAVWAVDARRQISDFGSGELGCRALVYVGLDRRSVWAFPTPKTLGSLRFDHAASEERKAALDLAQATRGPAISATVKLSGPGATHLVGFVIYSPVIRTGAMSGFVAAEYEYQKFFSTLVTKWRANPLERYHVAVAIGGANRFRLSDPADELDARQTVVKTYVVATKRIQISLTPTGAALTKTRRFLPEVVLFLGCGITLLLGLSVHLTRKALLRAAAGAVQRPGDGSTTRPIHWPFRPKHDGPRADPATPPVATAQRVFGGRYRLVREIGRGGMGVVWGAEDTKLHRTVALKLLPEMVVRDREAMVDLAAETRRCLELTHPHIVRVYDLVEADDQAAISMEFVDGPSLADHKLAQPGRCFTPATLVPWIAQLCSALDYAHHKVRLVHRDLKPLNLLLNSAGDLKVVDFGISRSLGKAETRLSNQPRSSGFSLAYAGPQQLLGEPPAVTDDIYSLGVTVYELLTGRPPFFDGEIITQIREVVPPKMADRRAAFGVCDRGDIPAAWELAIAACLAKKAADRPQSAAEVAERLGVVIGSRKT